MAWKQVYNFDHMTIEELRRMLADCLATLDQTGNARNDSFIRALANEIGKREKSERLK